MFGARELVRLVFIFLIGAALLLLSAVAEGGESELSRVLVPKTGDVPQMIEALTAGGAIAFFGAFAASYIEDYYKK